MTTIIAGKEVPEPPIYNVMTYKKHYKMLEPRIVVSWASPNILGGSMLFTDPALATKFYTALLLLQEDEP